MAWNIILNLPENDIDHWLVEVDDEGLVIEHSLESANAFDFPSEDGRDGMITLINGNSGNTMFGRPGDRQT